VQVKAIPIKLQSHSQRQLVIKLLTEIFEHKSQLLYNLDEINQDGNMTTKTVTTIEDTNLIKSSSSISNICDNKSFKTTKKLALNFGRKRRPTKR
jgi:flagellar biosynthesis/type III secretory pathway chaperone